MPPKKAATKGVKAKTKAQDKEEKKQAKVAKSQSKEKTPKAGKAEKKPKRQKKDKNAPKKAISAFFCYQKVRRTPLKEEAPELDNKSIIKRMTEEWKALRDDQKKIYMDMHEKDKERYANQMREYKKKLGTQEGAPVTEKGEKLTGKKRGPGRVSTKSKSVEKKSVEKIIPKVKPTPKTSTKKPVPASEQKEVAAPASKVESQPHSDQRVDSEVKEKAVHATNQVKPPQNGTVSVEKKVESEKDQESDVEDEKREDDEEEEDDAAAGEEVEDDEVVEDFEHDDGDDVDDAGEEVEGENDEEAEDEPEEAGEDDEDYEDDDA